MFRVADNGDTEAKVITMEDKRAWEIARGVRLGQKMIQTAESIDLPPRKAGWDQVLGWATRRGYW